MRRQDTNTASGVRFLRTLTFLASILLGAGSAAPAQDCFLPGDVDCNGMLDMSDPVTLLAQLYLGAPAPVCPGGGRAADVNRDGEIDLFDALISLGWQFLGLTDPPVPSEPVCDSEPMPCPQEPAVEPGYAIRASAPIVSGDLVELGLEYRSPTGLQGIQIGFDLPAGLTPLGIRLAPAFPRRLDVNQFKLYGSTLVLVLSSNGARREDPEDPEHLLPPEVLLPATDGEWRDLVTLRFTTTDPQGETDIRWQPVIDTGSSCKLHANMISAFSSPEGLKKHYPAYEEKEHPEGFRRGDLSIASLWSLFWQGGAQPLDCQGIENPDVADLNDNESLTVADFLLLRHSTAAGGEIPGPTSGCGLDPSEDRRGFDQVDPLYLLTAGEVMAIRPPGPNLIKDIHIPIKIKIDTPANVTGVQFAVEYDANALEPYSESEGGAFAAVRGTAAARSFVDSRPVVERQDEVPYPGVLVVVLLGENDGEILLSSEPERFIELGTLRFHLRENAVFRPLIWLPEHTAGGLTYRASVVDDSYADHHPQLVVGEHKFVRGNANGDVWVDISDARFTFGYLFMGGKSPDCLDAADTNNDGEIDISDPVFTLSYLFLGGPTIPEPFPQCGFDQGTIDYPNCNPDPDRDACR